MKKVSILILCSILFLGSCEKDDICIDTTTSQLILRLYDDLNHEETKATSNMVIWAVGKDTLSAYNKVALDSIAIPLDLNKEFTTYVIENNAVLDTLTFSYDRNDMFVSRSCGYKTIFENINVESKTSNWIVNLSIENQTIENETTAHIYLYH